MKETGLRGRVSGTRLVSLILMSLVLLVVLCSPAPAAPGLTPTLQTPLSGKSIPQFVDPLPGLSDIGVIQAGTDTIQLNMTEFKTNMLPSNFVLPNGTAYAGTWTWGYLPNGTSSRPTYLGPVIVATRPQATTVKYVNNLGDSNTTNVLAYRNATDQTLHWADPFGLMANMMLMAGMPPTGEAALLYNGPIPATVHLHGAEVPAEVDGGPDSWFTSDGIHGPGYYTKPGVSTEANSAIYSYPNTQEAAPLWFHDHTLGATRLNVYAGLAGAYLLTDPDLTLPAGLDPLGLSRSAPTGDETLVPLIIQDRMFDTNGQLYFPNVGINPEHPYWVPEFVGDTICVNGKAWPYLDVKAQRYRFLIINGSNARTYAMSFKAQGTSTKSTPIFWQIGADGGYFDAPVPLQRLVVMPGQRADVIVDFAGLKTGTTITLENNARTPYPDGAPVNGQTTGRVMQFRVVAGAGATDGSFNPAANGVTIKGGTGQAAATVKLFDPATGNPFAPIANDRLLTLNEVMGMRMKVGGVQYPGGPTEILVNNTKWIGEHATGPRPDFTPVPVAGAMTTYYSELPGEGTTEIWEIANLTADAHPMHLHLVQFQLLNRQALDVAKYSAVYAAAFPGAAATSTTPAYAAGVYIPGFGPPLDYNTPNAAGQIGGNPPLTGFLKGANLAANPGEGGWHDTIMVPPGMVTRLLVRWAPTDLPAASATTNIGFPFDPSGGAHFGYVWHCHIVDHEDNEMMRPDRVIANPSPDLVRTFIQGTDY